MSRRRGFSLLELVVVFALAVLIAAVTALTLRFSARLWTQASGRDAAERELLRAERSLKTDLVQASLSSGKLVIATSPASLGGGSDGQAIDYLSAIRPDTRDTAILSDGSGNPYFFTNIVYYMTVPRNHQDLYGLTCTGGNEGGFDFNCPHKMLVRVVEDQNAADDPADPDTQDTLLPSLGSVMTQPVGYPRSSTRRAVATQLLNWQVTQQGGELNVVLLAVSVQDARSRVALGTTSLRSGPFTLEHRFSIYPRS